MIKLIIRKSFMFVIYIPFICSYFISLSGIHLFGIYLVRILLQIGVNKDRKESRCSKQVVTPARSSPPILFRNPFLQQTVFNAALYRACVGLSPTSIPSNKFINYIIKTNYYFLQIIFNYLAKIHRALR